MKQIISLSITCSLLVIFFSAKAQEIDRAKALWIIQNFAPNTNWSNEKDIESFSIGVYGNNTDVYKHLSELSANSKIKGKPFKVVRFNQLTDISAIHILYIEESSNHLIEEIYKKMGNNTLIITDNSTANTFSAINLLDLIAGRKKFDINKKVAGEFGITFDKAILLHGGS